MIGVQPQQPNTGIGGPPATAKRLIRRGWPWIMVGVSVLAAAGLFAVLTVASVRSPTSRVYGVATRASASAVDPGTDAATRSKPAAGTLAPVPTTLTVTILIKGNGAPLRAGQTVTTNYVGYSFQTGQEFDSSWIRGKPFTFTVGTGQVIRGWDQGLVGAPIGSRIQLDLPAALAYGDSSSTPASGPIRFIIDAISATWAPVPRTPASRSCAIHLTDAEAGFGTSPDQVGSRSLVPRRAVVVCGALAVDSLPARPRSASWRGPAQRAAGMTVCLTPRSPLPRRRCRAEPWSTKVAS